MTECFWEVYRRQPVAMFMMVKRLGDSGVSTASVCTGCAMMEGWKDNCYNTNDDKCCKGCEDLAERLNAFMDMHDEHMKNAQEGLPEAAAQLFEDDLTIEDPEDPKGVSCDLRCVGWW